MGENGAEIVGSIWGPEFLAELYHSKNKYRKHFILKR